MLSLLPVFLALAYVLGSIPMGILIAKLFQIRDPRTLGSGNIGAANMSRAGGIRFGALTFLADFLKGLLPVLLANIYLSENSWCLAAIGFLAVYGHCYSLFLKFSGGKGVATSLGVLIYFSPYAAIAAACLWGIAYYVTRTPAVASVLSLVAAVVTLIVLQADWTFIASGVLCTLLVIRRHLGNWEELLLQEQKRSFAP